MNFFGRRSCLSAIIIVAFLLFSQYSALAENCKQKRTTPKAPNKIYKQINPLEPTPENISSGKILYQKTAKPLACFQCHGTNGGGNGPMAKGMRPEPRNFSCKAMMEKIPDGQLFWIIKNGSKGTGMLGFKALDDDQVWQVLSYLRQFSS
jgi:mono/diheme cytochrome c family protein